MAGWGASEKLLIEEPSIKRRIPHKQRSHFIPRQSWHGTIVWRPAEENASSLGSLGHFMRPITGRWAAVKNMHSFLVSGMQMNLSLLFWIIVSNLIFEKTIEDFENDHYQHSLMFIESYFQFDFSVYD